MIELPEALTIARQMTAELQGKRIVSGLRGNARTSSLSTQPTQRSTPAS